MPRNNVDTRRRLADSRTEASEADLWVGVAGDDAEMIALTGRAALFKPNVGSIWVALQHPMRT